MTVWLHPAPLVQSSERTQWVNLPFAVASDLSQIQSVQELKRVLAEANPTLPPETLSRKADVIWHPYSQIAREDLMLFPASGNTTFMVADVGCSYRFHHGDHQCEVTPLPKPLVIRHAAPVSDHHLMIIRDTDIKNAAYALRHKRYRRFAYWRRIIVCMVAVKLLVLWRYALQ